MQLLPFFDGDSQLEIAGGVTCFSIFSFWLHVAAVTIIAAIIDDGPVPVVLFMAL